MATGGLHEEGYTNVGGKLPAEKNLLSQQERATIADMNDRATKLERSLAAGDVEPGGDIPSGAKSHMVVKPENSGNVVSAGFSYNPEVKPTMGNDPHAIKMMPNITLEQLQKKQKRYPCSDCEAASAVELAQAKLIQSDKIRKADLYRIETSRAIFRRREELQEHLLICEKRQSRLTQGTVVALIQGMMPALAAQMAQTVKEALREEKKADAASPRAGVVPKGADATRPKSRRQVG